MKKIAFYIGSMQYGGANRVMANLVNHFANLDYNVILINDIFPVENKPEYDLDNKIKRVYLENNTNSKIIKNIEMVFALRRIIKSEDVTTIVSFMGPPNIRMLLASFGLSCKKVVSVRNDPYFEYGNGLKRFFAKCLFNLADFCVFQTEDASSYFSKRIRNKSAIIFNPVRDSFYNIVRNPNPHNIISVGRFEKQKNHIMLIEAFGMIANEFQNENLILYGEGSMREELVKTVSSLDLDGRVFFPGNTSEVEAKLSEAKVFVLSSDYEGMPNALMEAMAAGVPVVSTNCPCGGPKSLIRSDDEGILVDCNNSIQLSNSLRLLLSDNDKCNRMSQNEKQRATEFKDEKVFSKWEYIV